MNARRPLTRLAHELLARHLSAGDIAIDATAGNGHDTLFLARQVGPQGEVHAFDIQKTALEATRERLMQANCDTQVHLHRESHASMADHLPPGCRRRIAAITFNLGYLPGGDHATTTTDTSTLAALQQGLSLLRPGGVLSILAYRGHPGGQHEAEAVAQWCAQQTALSHEIHESPGPVLHFCVLQQP